MGTRAHEFSLSLSNRGPCGADSSARLGSHTAQRSAPTGVELFTEGDALYAAMLESIRGARLTVRMESYLFVDDEIGR